MGGSDARLDGSDLRIALVVSRYNDCVTDRLLLGAQSYLDEHGCLSERRTVIHVPGAWELPLAASRIAGSGDVDAIVALGALIRGETSHFEHIAAAVAAGLARVALDSGVPTSFGVLTTDTVEQALARAGGVRGDKGREAAQAALEMALLCAERGGRR